MGHEEVRVPPQNTEAEKSVLGAMLMDDEAIGAAVEILEADFFYEEAHRKIFRAIVELYQARKNADLITICDRLKSDGDLEAVGGASYLTTIINFVPTAANIQHYAQIVKEKGILRKLIKNATQIVTDSFAAASSAEEIVDNAERLIFDIADMKEKHQTVHIKDVIKANIEKLDLLYQKKQHVTGLPTGFTEIDKYTSGLQKSDLIIIAARPSMGKTALAMSIAERAAIDYNAAVGVFSLEMSKEQLVQRLLCSQAKVDAQKVRTGFFSSAEWPKLTKAASQLSAAKIFIDDTPAISALELRAKARRLKASQDIQLIVLDYIQLMRSTKASESRQQEISEISRSLKALARELEVPVIALSQLSRAVESRQDHKPQLSDLRESGAIEQDADVVILLLREEYYNSTEENRGVADVIIAKQRNGPVGTVKLQFTKEFIRFENLAHGN
ncbi:MAG: replicative DNA helicase [Candidatus Omnitrophica bacterium]|nr:replicative DNA helicase [Candidatus Omnitrophota bacterium]